MKHFILVRFNDKAIGVNVVDDMKNFFEDAKKIKGVNDVTVSKCAVKFPNRFDSMITITFANEADLMSFEDSSFNHAFKKQFGPYFSTKVLYDED
ncbi:MAG: Dabb family protein [Bacilli bacterium]